MPIELDHLFICTQVGAPAGQRLIEFGLHEGTPNRHPGQGTANRRFFFANAFLELVWVEDTAEAQSLTVRRTGLWERWSQREDGSCPFGIGFRPAGQTSDGAPFATWTYRPPYLPPPLAIEMSTDSQNSREPLLFYLAFGRGADADNKPSRQPMMHASGLHAITRVRVSVPEIAAASAGLRAVEKQCPGIRFASGSEALMEVGFDHETANESHDFRPSLPLILRW